MAISEDQAVKVAMGEPPRLAIDTSPDDRQALLTALAHATGPQRIALQSAYDRTYGGSSAPAPVARAMRDGFPEARGPAPVGPTDGTPTATTRAPVMSDDDVLKAAFGGGRPAPVAPSGAGDDDLLVRAFGPPPEGALSRASRIARDPEGGILPAAGSLVSHVLGGDSAPSTSGGVMSTAADIGRKAIVGVNDLGQSAVGLISLATGGVFGDQMAKLGYDPKAGDALISSYNSTAQQQADANVAQAQGFVGKLAALAVEPRAILGQVIEMLPGLAAMGAGGAAAAGSAVRAVMPAALDAAAAAGLEGKAAEQFIAKFITEKAKAEAAAQLGTSAVFGGQTAGTIAEEGRASGQDYSTYAPAALVAGLATVATAYGSKAAASAMGVGDVTTDLATRMAGAGTSRTAGGFAGAAAKEGTKGALENAAFSGISGVGTNVATGQDPLANDIGGQIGQGAAVGALVSGAHGAIAGKPARPGEPAPVAETQHPLEEAVTGYLQSGDSAQVAKDIAGAPTVEAAIDAAHAHSQSASALLAAAASGARDVRAEAGRQAAARAAIDALATEPGEPPKVPEAPISAPAAGRIDSSQYADLTPMDRRTAEGRLRAMQDMEPAQGEGTGLNVVDHPDGTGRFAIGRVGGEPDATRAGPATNDVGSTSVFPETPPAAAPPAEPPKTRQVVSALKLPPHERSAVENARIQAAERHYTPEDMGVLRKAAQQPFAMTAAERVRFGDMKASEARESAPAQPVAKDLPQEIVRTKVQDLPRQSEAKAGELSQETHKVVQQVARIFGKKLVVYEGGPNDGFVRASDPNTIYLNRNSSKPHLVVFGHELLHTLRADSPKAYDALASVIKLRQGVDTSNVKGIRGDHEELTADLLGNHFADPHFWADTFREIMKDGDHPANRAAVMKLGAVLTRTVSRVVRALKGAKGFDSDSMVGDLDKIRDASKSALSQYAKDRYSDAQALDREGNSGFEKTESPTTVDATGAKASSGRVPHYPGREDVDRVVGHLFSEASYYGPRYPVRAAELRAKMDTVKWGLSGNDVRKSVDAALESFGKGTKISPAQLAEAVHERLPSDTGTKFSESRGKLEPDDLQTKARGKDGTDYDVILHKEMLGDKLHSVYVKAEDADGKLAGWVEFNQRRDGVLTGGMVKAVTAGRGVGEILYRAARSAGYDIAPSAIRTDAGRGFTARLAEKGVINVRASEKRNDDGIDVEGIHYSKEPRKVLSSAMAGTGMKGAERERGAGANRINFYVDKGQGVAPEGGVGGYAHKAKLTNLYDAGNDPRYLKEDAKDNNDFEQRVQDAGYNGYYAPDFTTRQGAAVLLGKHEVPVEQVGQGARPPNGLKVLRQAREDVGFRATVADLRALRAPAGSLTGADWADRLKVQAPDIYRAMDQSGVFARLGTERLYKDELIRKYKDLARPQESAQADYDGELAFAKKMIDDDAPIEQAPYYDDYEKTIDAEASLLTPRSKVMFVGSGPLPLSPILFADKGFRVAALDINPEAKKVGEAVAKKVDVPLSVQVGDATHYDFAGHDAIVLALEAGADPALKRNILEQIQKTADPDAQILLRGSKGDDFVSLKSLLPDGMKVVDKVETWGGLGETVSVKLRREATLNDFSKENVASVLHKSNWAILTAEDPFAKKAPKEQNDAAMARLTRDLEAMPGVEFKPAEGSYGDVQNGFIVTGISEAEARALGRKYDQESILTNKGLLYNDGRIARAEGIETYRSAPADFYTKVGDTYFSVKLGEETRPDGVRASAKRTELDPDVVQALGKHIRNLTPDERARLRKDTAQKLVDTIATLPSSNEMAAVAYAGRAKRGWYARSAAAIDHVFGPDGPRFAALLAALSPRQAVGPNLTNALKIWHDWNDNGRPTDAAGITEILDRQLRAGPNGKAMDAWVNNSVRALGSEDPSTLRISGPKVNSFMLNLRGHVDEVTNDGWMAAYAKVDQALFAGRLRKDEADSVGVVAGKSAGYMAMSAQVRAAAKTLSRLTGDEWTPAEVQETIWSWAKALAERGVVNGSAVDFVKNKGLTDALIQSTPDFRTLFHDDINEKLLRDAGLGDRVDSLRSRGDLGEPEQEGAVAQEQAAPFAEDTQQRYELAAARRLDAAREPADDVVASAKREPSDEELAGRKVTYPVHVEETGETAHVTVDAREELAAYTERESVMRKLADCLAR